MNGKIVIMKFVYLKKPLYMWTLRLPEGGSFSNSGMHRSLIKCIQHARANARGGYESLPTSVYAVDENGNETLVSTFDLLEGGK